MKKILFFIAIVLLINLLLFNYMNSITVAQNDTNAIIDVDGSGILKITQRNIGVEIIKYYYFDNELLVQYIIEYTYGNMQDAQNKYMLETENNNSVELYNNASKNQHIVRIVYVQDTLWQVFFELPNKNDLIIEAEEKYMTWSYEKVA